MVLSSNTLESKVVWGCISALKQQATNTIYLMSEPGYEGIVGNEATDLEGG